jgi:hypothetical protein
MQACELDGGLVGLGAGVGEEDALHTGQRAQLVPEPFLRRNPVEVGHVDEPTGLIAQGVTHGGVRVPEPANRDAGQSIEVPVAVGVPEPRAFPALEARREATVGFHQVIGHRYIRAVIDAEKQNQSERA